MLLSTLHRIDKLLSMELEPEPGGSVSDELSEEIIQAADACAKELIGIYRASTTLIPGEGTLRMDALSQNIMRLAGSKYPAVKLILAAKLKSSIHIDDVLDEGDAKLIDFISIVSVMFDVDIITEEDMKNRRVSSTGPNTCMIREQKASEPIGPR